MFLWPTQENLEKIAQGIQASKYTYLLLCSLCHFLAMLADLLLCAVCYKPELLASSVLEATVSVCIVSDPFSACVSVCLASPRFPVSPGSQTEAA